jgi:SAM-dependent MidA family methyltransferase
METVLYHPELGYYSSDRNPIGPGGDFYTSPNVDPAMGRLLARLFAEMAAGIDGFTVVELGAGTGFLARHVLESRAFPYVIVERSGAMRERQRRELGDFGVEWSEAVPDGIRGCVFSNEFFDALPVRRFARRDGAVREIFVGEGLAEIEGEPDPPVELPLLGEGCVADVAPGAVDWVRRIGNAMIRGYHLAIDYGYVREDFFSHPRGTLMCYRRHVADEDPYQDPGEKDITAHVNFSDLIDAGREVGLDLRGYRAQKDFLVDLGLLEIMRPLAGSRAASSVKRLQALKNLILPPMMGERFRVLLQAKGVSSRELPGFR